MTTYSLPNGMSITNQDLNQPKELVDLRIDDNIIAVNKLWSSKKTSDTFGTVVVDANISATEQANISTIMANVATNQANLASLSLQAMHDISFTTKAIMDSNLTYNEGTTALVSNDPIKDYNGIYNKLGENGVGEWLKSEYIPPIVENSVDDSSVIVNSLSANKLNFMVPSKNLFDKDSFYNEGYYVNLEGGLTALADWGATDYIPVETNEQYVEYPWHNIAFYDDQRNIISASFYSSVFTTPVNCKYLRAGFLLRSINEFQIEKGVVPTTFSPYKAVMNDIMIDGSNILKLSIDGTSLKNKTINENAVNFITLGKNLFDGNDSDIVIGKYLNEGNGAFLDASGYNISGFCAVSPSTEYRRNYDHNMCYYDINKIYISGRQVGNNGSFTTPSNCYYIRTTINDATFPFFQLEEGSITTIYEAFGYKLKKDWYLANPKLLNEECYYKNVTFLGDSQTEIGLYPPIVQYLLKIPTIYNKGLSGSSISQIPDNPVQSFNDRYPSINPLSDLIVIYGGINDFNNNVAIGDITSTNTVTFYGALKALIEGLMTAFPTTKLMFITPGQKDNGETTNGSGHKAIDYVDAMINICGKYGHPCGDLYRNAGINQFNINTFTSDGLHWNLVGAERVAKSISGLIKNN